MTVRVPRSPILQARSLRVADSPWRKSKSGHLFVDLPGHRRDAQLPCYL